MITVEQADPLNMFYGDPPRLLGQWLIKWTGYKIAAETIAGRPAMLVGQWVAYPTAENSDKRYFYASTPGGTGIYERGGSFLIEGGEAVLEEDFSLPTLLLYGKAGRLRQATLNRLLQTMRAAGAEGTR